MAADVAEEQVFRDVTPGEDGFVRLWFSNQAGSPLLNALELTPGIPGKLKPIRILTQPTSFVDHKGQRWRADDYFFERLSFHRASQGERHGGSRAVRHGTLRAFQLRHSGGQTRPLHGDPALRRVVLRPAASRRGRRRQPGSSTCSAMGKRCCRISTSTRKRGSLRVVTQDFLEHQALRAREDQSRFRTRREQCDGVGDRGAGRVPRRLARASTINSQRIPRSAADTQFMDSNEFTVSPAGGTKATSPSGRSEHSNSTR